MVTALALARGWAFPRTSRDWLATLALGGGYTAMTVLFFLPLRFLTAGIATIVLYSYSTFVVVLSAALLGESITARKLLTLGLATVGVAFVVETGTIGVNPIGIGFALGSTLFYAVYTTGSRTLSPTVAPSARMIGVLVGATASMVVYGVVDGGFALPTGRDEVGVVLGIAIVSTVIPHLLFYEGVFRLAASWVGLVRPSNP